MAAKTSLPPTHHHPHLTKPLPPSAALEQISHFLHRTQTKPYLHPDSLLSRTGITYSAHSGPGGGLAIHHLKRIEAGLKGENLVAEEVQEEWDYQDGDGDGILPASDDRRLDALILRAEGKGKMGGKRKRSMEDISAWAEISSQAGAPLEHEGEGVRGGLLVGQEIESFANTPLHDPDWQEQEEYEAQQSPLEGEVGEREGAPMVRQNGSVPDVLEHDDQGNVKRRRERERGKGKGKSEEQKLAKKEEKRAKKMARRMEKAEEAKRGKG